MKIQKHTHKPSETRKMSTEKIAHIQFNKNECNQTIPIGRERDRFPLDLFQSASDRFKFIFENICTYMRMCSRVCSIQCIEGRGQGRQTRPLSSLYWQLEKDRIDGAIAYILLGDCMRYSSSIIDAFFLAEWETIVCAFFSLSRNIHSADGFCFYFSVLHIFH